MVVAEATKWIGFCTEDPFPGELTETPPNADTADRTVTTRETRRDTHFPIENSPLLVRDHDRRSARPTVERFDEGRMPSHKKNGRT
jgi:hypothetical protein